MPTSDAPSLQWREAIERRRRIVNRFEEFDRRPAIVGIVEKIAVEGTDPCAPVLHVVEDIVNRDHRPVV